MPDVQHAAPRQCAFLTLEERGNWVIDDETAIPALESAGWSVATIPWNRPAVDWGFFDLVVVRSTWDYWDAPEYFFTVLESIHLQTRLANPLALMRWNLSKTYLRDLAKAGVPIVPTRFIEKLSPDDLVSAQGDFAGDGWVLKPQIGASGIDAFLFRAGSGRQPQALERLAGTAVLIQPFRRSVIEEGEYSLFYFDGSFSHAICKRPARGEFRSQEERGAAITALEPAQDLRRVGALALAALAQRPLYARVDLVRNHEGEAEIMELELIEPSLYFRTNSDAPAAFARALEGWLSRHPHPGVC